MKKLFIFRRKKNYFTIVLLILFSVISIYPLLYLLFYSLKTNDEIFYTNPFGIPLAPQFDNYRRAVQLFDIVGFFKNSMVITLFSVMAILILALPFSYAISRMHWKLKNTVSFYLSLGLFIPIQVIIVPLSILVKNMHISNTYLALIIPYIAFNLAFACMVLSSSFSSLPQELEESAFIDGSGVFRTFLEIMIPLVKPAISTAIIFATMSIWNEYTLASILATDQKLKTLPVGLTSFVGEHSTDWGAMGACLVIASIPTVILYLCCSEQVEKALTVSGAVKG
ncbi:carbohydrate ABC transporter permease [Diplocloster agilis]|uniref:carbohydrate ABC transporter permease n=1 Tax=Diplocloster agilis TaxID=2850323 RepID=UPI001EE869E5